MQTMMNQNDRDPCRYGLQVIRASVGPYSQESQPRATGGSTSIEAPLPTVQEVMSLLNNSALIDG
jgi:hypothetical protein